MEKIHGSVVPGTNLVTRWTLQKFDGIEMVRGEVIDVSDWSVRYDSGWQVEDSSGSAQMWISYEITGVEAGEFYGAVLKLEGWSHHEVSEGMLAYRIDGASVDQAILVRQDGTVELGKASDYGKVYLTLEDLWKGVNDG